MPPVLGAQPETASRGWAFQRLITHSKNLVAFKFFRPDTSKNHAIHEVSPVFTSESQLTLVNQSVSQDAQRSGEQNPGIFYFSNLFIQFIFGLAWKYQNVRYQNTISVGLKIQLRKQEPRNLMIVTHLHWDIALECQSWAGIPFC